MSWNQLFQLYSTYTDRPKMLIIQFSYMENANHTLLMQLHKNRKLHERSMISDFSHMEIV